MVIFHSTIDSRTIIDETMALSMPLRRPHQEDRLKRIAYHRWNRILDQTYRVVMVRTRCAKPDLTLLYRLTEPACCDTFRSDECRIIGGADGDLLRLHSPGYGGGLSCIAPLQIGRDAVYKSCRPASMRENMPRVDVVLRSPSGSNYRARRRQRKRQVSWLQNPTVAR